MQSEDKSRESIYRKPEAPIDQRVNDLLLRMTLPQKVSQMFNSSKPGERAEREYRTRSGYVSLSLCWATGIPELGIPSYEWWNECLHGCASSWNATVFPQAIGLAAAWNPEMMHRIGTAISDEARAKHHDVLRRGVLEPHTGLTYWSPNVNIFRDPRWGRGQETYGEDPYLTSETAVAFVRALQGTDGKYLKLVATPKHFAVHSGPEKMRHQFDARVSERDLRETYLPAFKACIQKGNAASVMGAYSRLNGEPCCASKRLLIDILRREWGFDGFVVADNLATNDIYEHHRVVGSSSEAAALSVRNGCDLDCGEAFGSLTDAVAQGLITEAEIDAALRRLFAARFRLGMFDHPDMVPYSKIPVSVIDCDAHRQLALDAARQSMVLLKNAGGILPLSEDIRSIAVIGHNADDNEVLRANYAGTPSREVTALEGIRNRAGSTRVLYARGCDLNSDSTIGFDEACKAARAADVAVLVLGNSVAWESEEDHAWESEVGDDRPHIALPGVQEKLLQAVCDTGTPVVLLLMTGSALAVNWADEQVPAILNAWYPGEEGGTAIAEALFGDFSPGGRLPVTFYKSLSQLPPFEDYSMAGRTYRYFTGEPLYPFGYGLSYTDFQYSDLRLSSQCLVAGDPLDVSVIVKNTGLIAGDEVVQLYLSDVEASYPVPIRSLQGFHRIHLEPGESENVRFSLDPEQISLIDDEGRRLIEAGQFVVAVGGGQPFSRGVQAGRNLLNETFEVDGSAELEL